ncbi:MAG: hypothetical protein HFG32_08845 [Eubacterium sp.]|jgi:uncharacterized protein YjdB|nr:hypothetical protein [Eubacterium sp.]
MKRFAKKALAGTLSLALVLSFGVVSNPDTASAAKVKVKKVTVNSPSGKTAYIAKGKKVKLTTTVKVTPNKSANKKVAYKSANSKIAKVNSKGQITGVRVGKTKITVTSKKNKKKKATIKVVVKNAAVSKVKLNVKKMTLGVGARKTLRATISPKNASKTIQWKTSNKKVATVSVKGAVKGKKEGTATITALAADGSGKKATCKVTVGAGIKNVEVPNASIVRVSLTSAKKLTAANFVIQNKKASNGVYNTSEGVESVVTNDGGKTYDVELDNESGIRSYSYVNVTISALKVDKSKEVYVGNVPSSSSYGVVNTVSRVTGKVGDGFEQDLYLDDVDSTGVIKYSVTGLPEGLKAYVSKDATRVSVKGKFKKVENGTTAVLTGVDELNKTFKKNYVFYVGDDNTIVGNFLGDTVLAYDAADDPNTPFINEASGHIFSWDDIDDLGDGVIVGGSGSYEYAATGLPAQVETMTAEGVLYHKTDAKGDYEAVPAATYNVNVTVKDKKNPNLQVTFPFALTVVNGVTLTGTVKDASGAPAKNINIAGNTKRDMYGRYDRFSTYSRANGTYKVRLIPGVYSQGAYFDGGYGYSVGNSYTAGTVTKDFSIPLYKVNILPSVLGGIAYDLDDTTYLYNANGVASTIKVDEDDFSLYTYLKAGLYEFSPAADSEENIVEAYSKVSTRPSGWTYLDEDDFLGYYQLSGKFNVAGNGSVPIEAAKVEF